MDATIHSDSRKLVSENYLTCRMRLESSLAGDVHRDFVATYFPSTRSMAIMESKVIGRAVKMLAVHPEAQYKKPDGDWFVLADFKVGTAIRLGSSASQRSEGKPKMFVITSVDTSRITAIDTVERPEKGTDEARDQFAQYVRERIRARGGGKGKMTIKNLGRTFRIMDDTGDRKASPEEIKEAMHIHVGDMEPEELDALMDAMDRDDDGSVSYEEFLRFVRGPMSEARKQCVRQAFRKMDFNKNGVITIEDVAGFYSALYHPKVQSGEMTEAQVLQKFLARYDMDANGVVTYEEFEDYYNGVSADIDTDEQFIAMMSRAWNLDHRNATRIPFH